MPNAKLKTTKIKLGRAASRVRGSKVPSKYGQKPKINRAFQKRNLRYSVTNKRSTSNVPLKRLQQMSFLEIATMSETEAKKHLQKHGVLGGAKETCVCWLCGTKMEETSEKGVVRCPNSSCKRPRLHDLTHAFTPLQYLVKCNDDTEDYVLFAKSAFALGCKLPLDAAVQMIRAPQDSVYAIERKAGKYIAGMKMALAFSEYEFGQSVQFRSEVVEPDSARTGSARSSSSDPSKKEHQGRTLVLKGRTTKKWCAIPLRPATSAKGRGMPPEKVDEVLPPLESALGPGTFMGADGAKAWKSAGKTLQVPVVGKVNHQQKNFTPLGKFKKSELSKAQKRTLSAGAAAKQPCVEEGAHHYWLPGGDNAAEGTISHIKGVMRRLGVVGRGNSQKPDLKTVQSMAGAALLREPGYLRILAAVARFRQACLTGDLRMAPKDAFRPECAGWLYTMTDGDTGPGSDYES